MNYPINRLWGGLPTEKNLALSDKYPHFYANSDHVLVISPEQPDGFAEIKGKLEEALEPGDWRWIIQEQRSLLREQEVETGTTLEQIGDAFLNRFEAELEAKREEIAHGRAERQNEAE